MIKHLVTPKGDPITLLDLSTITPEQQEMILLGAADLLIRGGILAKGAAIDGPGMLQFMGELADHLEEERKNFPPEDQEG